MVLISESRQKIVERRGRDGSPPVHQQLGDECPERFNKLTDLNDDIGLRWSVIPVRKGFRRNTGNFGRSKTLMTDPRKTVVFASWGTF
jgi:hypothetical protein